MLNENTNNNGNNSEKFKEGNNMVEQERYIDLAYARVSTKGQSLERQEQSILKAVPDIQERYFFKDKYTGKDFESRPAFNELKKKIDEIKEINPQAKIRLTVHEIDRLGRDYNELLKEFIDLSEKGVMLNALDIPKEIAEQTGVAGNLVYMILILYKSAMAQQELEYKHKRTMEGIAVAKQNGVRFGRQAIEINKDRFMDVANRAIERKITHNEAMKILDMSGYLYWKWIKQLFPDYKPNKKKVGVCKNE